MTKLRKFMRFAVFVVLSVVGWQLVLYFDIPDYIVPLVLLVAVYVQHEFMLERLSGDLDAVESFLDERFPDEAHFTSDDPALRRSF